MQQTQHQFGMFRKVQQLIFLLVIHIMQQFQELSMSLVGEQQHQIVKQFQLIVSQFQLRLLIHQMPRQFRFKVKVTRFAALRQL